MLEIRDLSACYNASTPVLRDFNLALNVGEIAAVIGPNGCGKSTLLRCIAGLLKLQSGSITLDGKDVFSFPARERARQIAVLPQQSEVADVLTVEELVLLGRTPHLSPYGAPSQHDVEIAAEAMGRTSTLAMKSRLVAQLSGGERQRVLLARALAQQPRVLLLDEPTSNLDLRFQYEILNLAHGLARNEQLTVIVVLHQINLASSLADTLVLLNADGSTHALGNAEQVIRREHLEAVYGVPLQISRHAKSGRPQAFADWSFGD